MDWTRSLLSVQTILIDKSCHPLDSEGLSGVNRQPSNGQKYFYRQPQNERAKIGRQISFLIF